MTEVCKYRLPCGRCDKYDKFCDLSLEQIGCITKNKCEHNWVFNGSMSNSAGEHIYYKCLKCGATKLMCDGIVYESSDEWQT